MAKFLEPFFDMLYLMRLIWQVGGCSRVKCIITIFVGYITFNQAYLALEFDDLEVNRFNFLVYDYGVWIIVDILRSCLIL